MTFEVPALAAGFASKFDEIGPYIGFGSLVAVVAMAVLVFAQGRELQRLREWAGTSPERLDALEQEFHNTTLRSGRPIPPARPGYVAPTSAGTAAPGAPPLPPGAAPPPAPGVPGAPGAVPAAPGSPVVGAGSATPPGVPVAAGAPRPTPPRPTGGFGGSPTRVVPAMQALGGPRAATAAGAAASTARERDREGDAPKRSIGQIVGVSVVGVVVLLALLFAFGVIGGNSDSPGDKPATNAGGATTTTGPKTTAPRYPRTEMKTVVLNASGRGGLAGDVSEAVENELRFPMGKADNYTVNGAPASEQVTLVQYQDATGQTLTQNRRAAQDLAAFLKKTVPGVRVQKMTDNVALLAQNQRLVVLVGQDYAAKVPPTSGSAAGTSSGTSSGSGGTAGGTGGASSGTGAAAGTSGTTGGTTGGATGSTSSSTAAPSTGLGTTDGAVDGTSDTGGTTLP